MPGLADLQTITLTHSGTNETGSSLTLSAELKNIGTNTAINSVARFCVFVGGFNPADQQNCYTNSTNRIGPSDLLIGLLNPTQSSTPSISWIPLAANNYTLYFCGDVTDVVNEGINNTADSNCESGSVTIVDPPPTPTPTLNPLCPF